MKFIINCSSLNAGGGIQVALSLLEEFKHFDNHEFNIVYTKNLSSQLKISEFPKNFKFYCLELSPILLKKIISYQNALIKIENEIMPDCVITIFGPSYWRPKAPHVMGYALGHFLLTK